MSGTLTHTPSQIIRQLLIDLGYGADGGVTWPVYATVEPDTPDSVITVYDTTGAKQGRQQVDGLVLMAYGLQIKVRSKGVQTSWSKANAIALGLDGSVQLTTTTVTDPSGYGTATQGYVVTNISRAGDILQVNDPDNNLKVYTINILAKLKQSA